MALYRWAREFEVKDDDFEFIMNNLLESETPMNTKEIAVLLVERRLEQERAKIEEQYKDTVVYNPAKSFEIGTRLVFTTMEMATGKVEAIRDGENTNYGNFSVIGVKFDEAEYNYGKDYREFAAGLEIDHALSSDNGDELPILSADETAEDIIIATEGEILYTVRDALRDNDSLERVAGYWFARELVMEFDVGTIHLAEAVLDMNGGGPLSTEQIIEQVGGIGNAPLQLQVFSLNLALNNDVRFSEVGAAGEVLWFLRRMMPEGVRKVPPILAYTPPEYNDELLSDEMFDLETELDDEYTPIEFEGKLRRAASTLIYPHRRAGTLPLNAKNRAIFPRARTPIIYVEFVDDSDGETFAGWVVHEHRYVLGLQAYYEKHSLPVGAFINVERGAKPGQIKLSFEAYKSRTEWIRVLIPNKNQVSFENRKRAIGANYDEFVIIGVDDVAGADALGDVYGKKSLTSILRELIAELSKLSPQGTVHAVTLYSAINILRRSAPGPIFATLTASTDFVDLGDHYWALASNQ